MYEMKSKVKKTDSCPISTNPDFATALFPKRCILYWNGADMICKLCLAMSEIVDSSPELKAVCDTDFAPYLGGKKLMLITILPVFERAQGMLIIQEEEQKLKLKIVSHTLYLHNIS